MLNRTAITPEIYDYVTRVGIREPDILQRLHEETAAMPDAEMMIPPEEGQFLNLLVSMIKAKKTLEVGVFTGYSSLWTALALPDDGHLLACDSSDEWTAVARRYWSEAGVSHKCHLYVGPASEILEMFLRESHGNTFDFAFIDADKVNYDDYYEKTLQLVRPGGVIVIDNVFRSGEVLDETNDEPGTVTVRALNEKLRRDDRISLAMLTVADGITLAIKKD
jgi:predicted O-methyltransferase YrrM